MGLCRVPALGELGSGPAVSGPGPQGETESEEREKQRETQKETERHRTETERAREYVLQAEPKPCVASPSHPPPRTWVQGDNMDLTSQWEECQSVGEGQAGGRREVVDDGWRGGRGSDRGTFSGKSKPRLMPRPIAPGRAGWEAAAPFAACGAR